MGGFAVEQSDMLAFKAIALVCLLGYSEGCGSQFWQSFFNNINTPTATTAKPNPVNPPNTGGCKCGQKTKDIRIVNGVETEENEYPWQIGLASSSNHYTVCGGSIISEKTILSAAHCTYGKSAGDYVVMVGGHNQNSASSSQYKKVCKIYNHPSYNPSNTDMDFSILELCDSLTFSEKVQPVCLPDNQNDGSEFENLVHTVTGWGTTSSGGSASYTALLEADVTTMSNDACCASPYKYGCSSITNNMMCAAKPSTDSCQGDSGGPLVTYSSSKKSHIQTGVVSWGRGCALAEYPGAYSRVSMVMDWIKGKMNGGTCYEKPKVRYLDT